MELKNYFPQDRAGNVLPEALCRLFLAGTDTLASGLEDDQGNPLDNPFRAGSNGLVQFAAPNGRYDLEVMHEGRAFKLSVQCMDADEAIAIIADESGKAMIAASRAESASNSAFINADVKESILAGISGSNAVGVGQQFQIIEGDEVVRYRKDSESLATEVARYPTAQQVTHPSWAGKTSGWPDPFFRHLDVGESWAGRIRWRGSNLDTPLDAWELVDNPIFEGGALRKRAGNHVNGPIAAYVDELGAKAGDVITIRMLVVGAGAVVRGPVRPMRATHSGAADQLNSSPSSVTVSTTPSLLTAEVPVTEDTAYIWIYPHTVDSDGSGFDVIALWAYKGAATSGPSWPIVPDTTVIAAEAIAAKQGVQKVREAVNYAVEAQEKLVYDSAQVELDITNPQVNQTYTLPFSGWGGAYEPSGATFNAIRAAFISRNETPPEGRWSRLGVVVKAGVDANRGELVAVGSVQVNPDDDILENVTILLTDPVTGDVKTLDDTSLGPQYFIGVYAETVSGGPAGMSLIAANQGNQLGSSYYRTTRNPIDYWIAATGGTGELRVGFQHLLLANPRIESYYRPTKQFKQDVGAGGGGSPMISEPVSWAPPRVYVTHGIEGSIYLDGLIADEAADYAWAVSGVSQGMLQHERWTVNPNGTLSAPDFKVRIHEKRTGQMLTEHTLALVGASSNAGSGQTRRVQVIGDSFVAGGHITQTLLDAAAGDVMGIELIGTRGTGLNRHEGRGGWRIDDYATAGRTYYEFVVSGVAIEPQINSTRYTNNGATFTVQEAYLEAGSGRLVCSVTGGMPSASGTLTKAAGVGDSTITFSASSPVSGNPFWVGGQLDYAQYLLDNGLSTPQVAVIALGVNDAFGRTSDAAVIALAAERFDLLDELIASIKGAGVDSVALVPPSGPSSSQDSFAASYGNSYTQWRVKRNFVVWNQELVKRFAREEGSGIYIAPAGLNWDTVSNTSRAAAAPVNSRSTVMVERQSNGVHPAINGYQQIGDALWAFLKCTGE